MTVFTQKFQTLLKHLKYNKMLIQPMNPYCDTIFSPIKLTKIQEFSSFHWWHYGQVETLIHG